MKNPVLIVGIIIGIAFLTSSINAQTTSGPDKTTKVQTTQASQTTPGNFVDTNSDGVCDNFKNRGIQGNRAKFVDENGDGVCDNCKGKGKCGQANCCGKGMQKGNCQGMSKANCCSKGKGHQPRHRQNCTQQGTTPKPEKK